MEAEAAAKEANPYQIDLGNLMVYASHDSAASAKSFEYVCYIFLHSK